MARYKDTTNVRKIRTDFSPDKEHENAAHVSISGYPILTCCLHHRRVLRNSTSNLATLVVVLGIPPSEVCFLLDTVRDIAAVALSR